MQRAPPADQRKSRMDSHKKSYLPRPSCKSGSGSGSGSLDRLSGIQPLDSLPPHMRRSATNRHRSAESARATIGPKQPQRITIQPRPRPTMTMVKNTPMQSTPSCAANYYTPMSAMSNYTGGGGGGGGRTPSQERKQGRLAPLRNGIASAPAPDRRTITDQKWQKETSERVLSRLRDDDRLSQLLPACVAPLKPITIKLFLSLVNSFVGQKCQVNANNYIDKLPIVAKKFLYPGSMAKSWLKSVNAMHTYPQMLAFISYMLELHDFQELVAEILNLDLLYGANDDFPDRRIHVIRHHFYGKCWETFQMQYDDFVPDAADLIEALKKFKGVDDLDVDFLREEIQDYRRKLENSDMNERLKREQKLQNDVRSLEDHAKKLQKKISLERQDRVRVEEKNAQLHAAVDQSKNQIDAYKKKLKELHDQIGNQNITTKQYKDLLEEIQRIKAAAGSKHRVYEDIQNVKFSKDVDLAKAQKIALQSSVEFNKSLVTVGLTAGINLSSYSLEERDLLAGKTIDGIKETQSNLKRLEIVAEKEISTLRQQKCENSSKKQNTQMEINSLQHEIASLNGELAKLQKSREQKRMTAIENLNSKRKTLEVNKRKVEETSEKTRNDLECAQKLHEQWKNAEKESEEKVDRLRSDEPEVRQMCENESAKLLKSYIEEIRKGIPDMRAIIAESNFSNLLKDLSIE